MPDKQEPLAWWYEDSTGCVHMSMDMALGEQHERETGHKPQYLYAASTLASKDAEIERLQKQLGECTGALETGDKAIAENARLRKERDEQSRQLGNSIARTRQEMAEAAALREQVKGLREALEAQKTPRCAECSGEGVVSRSFGYIPCEACNGKGF